LELAEVSVGEGDRLAAAVSLGEAERLFEPCAGLGLAASHGEPAEVALDLGRGAPVAELARELSRASERLCGGVEAPLEQQRFADVDEEEGLGAPVVCLARTTEAHLPGPHGLGAVAAIEPQPPESAEA